MRILLHRIGDRFEVCPRLGLILMRSRELGSARVVHHVLDRSPAAAAGISAYDIILSLAKRPLDRIHHLVLSDRRPAEIVLVVFMPRLFARAKVSVRVTPEPFAPVDAVVAAAERHVAAHPVLPPAVFKNPRSPLVADLLATRRART